MSTMRASEPDRAVVKARGYVRISFGFGGEGGGVC